MSSAESPILADAFVVSQCDPAKALKALFDTMWAGPRYLLVFGGVCSPVTTLVARALPALSLVQVCPSASVWSHDGWCSLTGSFTSFRVPWCPRCPLQPPPPACPTGGCTGTCSARCRRTGLWTRLLWSCCSATGGRGWAWSTRKDPDCPRWCGDCGSLSICVMYRFLYSLFCSVSVNVEAL